MSKVSHAKKPPGERILLSIMAEKATANTEYSESLKRLRISTNFDKRHYILLFTSGQNILLSNSSIIWSKS